MAQRANHLSLIVKGPLANAKRAMHRHGVSIASCRVVGNAKTAHDIQCYTPCSTKAEHKVASWYAERGQSKAGRGYPPGTLLYYSGSCATSFGARRRRKRR